MKKVLLVLFFLTLCLNGYAADFSMITEDSIKAFIEIMPQYKEIVEKYGEDYEEGDVMGNTSELQAFLSEMTELLNQYGVTHQDFTIFIQKVTMAFASAQMQASGMPSMPFNLGGFGAGTSDEELDVVKKYADQIEAVFEE